jgi:diacylglycerol kinase
VSERSRAGPGGWLRARIARLGFALHGIAVFAREPHARFHFAAALAVATLALWLRVSRSEAALLALAVGLVLAAEALNSALEALADRVAPEPHPLVKKAKDIAAGGVLLAALAAALVGLLVLGPPLLARLSVG